MIGTRPDLAQPLSVLSQFLINPGRVHWDAALRLLAYVKATSQVGLRYTSETAGTLPKIIGTSDASWATHVDDCTSQAGYFFNLCGAAVSWRSYRIKKVVHSSTEAEYVTCSDAARMAEYHRNVLVELGLHLYIIHFHFEWVYIWTDSCPRWCVGLDVLRVLHCQVQYHARVHRSAGTTL